MEIPENPSGRRSTIVTSQLTVEHGIPLIGYPLMIRLPRIRSRHCFLRGHLLRSALLGSWQPARVRPSATPSSTRSDTSNELPFETKTPYNLLRQTGRLLGSAQHRAVS
jgi:hypothetical protein